MADTITPTPVAPTFVAISTPYPGTAAPQVGLDQVFIAHLRGGFSYGGGGGSLPPGTVLGTIPVGSRPGQQVNVSVVIVTTNAHTPATLTINTDGTMTLDTQLAGATTSTVNLDGITYS